MRTSPATAVLRACAAILAATLSTHALADDTELFVTQQGTTPGNARTNILFIIDTSGSMDTEVVTQEKFIPTVDFSGCYNSNAIYFGTTTTLPACNSQAFFAKSLNHCKAAENQFALTGQYGGFLLGWNPQRQRWEELTTDREVECQADRGVHGEVKSSPDVYAADGPTGPWAADASQEPAWASQYQLFDGNWLNWKTNPPNTVSTRIEIVRDVVNTLVDGLTNVNVGLMRFNLDNGASVIQALGNVDTTRPAFETEVNSLTSGGATPLAESLYEAGQYFRGGNVDFGNLDPIHSVAGSRTGGNISSPTYNSPVTAACQKNFIILLTDGEPNLDTGADAKIAALPDFVTTLGRTACDGTGDGHCLDDMAEYLFKHDISPTLPGVQNVIVNTIGFTTDVPLLAETARRGGGQYFLADDTASLTTILNELVRGVVQRSATFTAPVIPANVFNRTQTMNDVFVSVFEPTDTAHWPGNLKKYRFLNNVLTGQNGLPAVDPDTGFFSTDGFSFWSVTPDGNRVPDGGAANQIPDPNTRKVYTNFAGGSLTQAGNAVSVANSQLTAALLGVATTDRDRLINWARGQDVNDDNQNGSTTDARHVMGDPLHVEPVVVTYGGTAQQPDAVVYIATNDGYLHAIDPVTGRELWSFIPARLLPRLQELFLNGPTPVHRYGLDGAIRVVIRHDDGLPGISGGEQAILVFGMGRGGDSVFAIDVTNRNSPQLLWEISSTTPGFQSLGQTWSTPSVAKVDVAGAAQNPDKLVAIFGGGYDSGQDNRGYRADQVGNGIYMVDIVTGTKLWSAGLANAADGHDLTLAAMTNSIPAPVSVLDLSGDGLADRMYVGDMGGRIWRFDIVNGNGRSSLVQGGVLASLGAAGLSSPAPADVRRFYAAPDVVLTSTLKRTFLAVNIGSGYRGHPLDTDVTDAFFSVRDYAVSQVIPTGQYAPPVTFSQLVDITDQPAIVLPIDSNGWLLRMAQGAGEKILSSSLTFANTVFFSSFTPTAAGDACVAGGGLNRAYIVSVLYGQPLVNLDGAGDASNLTATDRFSVLKQTGITPEPAYLSPSPAAPGETPESRICIGLECFPAEVLNSGRNSGIAKRWFWLQNLGP